MFLHWRQLEVSKDVSQNKTCFLWLVRLSSKSPSHPNSHYSKISLPCFPVCLARQIMKTWLERQWSGRLIFRITIIYCKTDTFLHFTLVIAADSFNTLFKKFLVFMTNVYFLISSSHGLGDCSTRGWREARLIFPVAFSLLQISVNDQTAMTTHIDFVMTHSDLFFWWWRLGVTEAIRREDFYCIIGRWLGFY